MCKLYTCYGKSSKWGGGEKTQYHTINSNTDKIYNIEISAWKHTPNEPIPPINLFEQQSTLEEINQYAILRYFFYESNAIESEQSISYYLDRMHELVSSIMQFQKNRNNDEENGYYDNHGKWHKYLISSESMQEMFSIAFTQIIVHSRSILDLSNRSNLITTINNFANKYKNSISNNSLNIKQEELLNIYYTFKDILYKYVK